LTPQVRRHSSPKKEACAQRTPRRDRNLFSIRYSGIPHFRQRPSRCCARCSISPTHYGSAKAGESVTFLQLWSEIVDLKFNE